MARTDMMANGQSQTNPHIHLHGYRRKVFLFQMRAAPQPIVSSEKYLIFKVFLLTEQGDLTISGCLFCTQQDLFQLRPTGAPVAAAPLASSPCHHGRRTGEESRDLDDSQTEE